MRHRVGTNRLNRRSGQRKALVGNMVTSLFRHERIRTTKPKALVVRSLAEKMVTRAKSDSVHNRRTIAKVIHDGEVVAKLFTDIGPRYVGRPGGYTRILKLGRRFGDAAEMVILELVDRVVEEKAKPEKAKEEPVKSQPEEGGEADEKPNRAARRAKGGSAAATEERGKDSGKASKAKGESPAEAEPAVKEAPVSETEPDAEKDESVDPEGSNSSDSDETKA